MTAPRISENRRISKAQWAWWTKFNTPAKRSRIARHAAKASAPARMAKTTPERRREIARIAGRAAWFGDFIPMPCPRCGSNETHHNGHKRGKQNWYCRSCKRQSVENPEPVKRGERGRFLKAK